MEKKKYYTHRYLARLIFEAKTPLAVSSGENSLLTDQFVVKDVNGLPYIPGTTIAGIVRHALRDRHIDDSFFGFQDNDKGEGSRIIFSSANMVGGDGRIVDGLMEKIDFSSDFYKYFTTLPVRQHVRINDKGVAEKYGKFDEEIVYQGCRFSFEIEMLAESENDKAFEEILSELYSSVIRIGGGSRSGFGEILMLKEKCKKIVLDLRVGADLCTYLEKTSGLNDEFWNSVPKIVFTVNSDTGWTKYELSMTASDFFLCGSGFGDDVANISPVSESVIVWDEGIPHFEENKILIPGSSIKGALSHRIAFYYNKSKNITIETLEKPESVELLKTGGYLPFSSFTGKDINDRKRLVTLYNPAVRGLFGCSVNNKDIVRGHVLISDVIKVDVAINDRKKLLNHISIDRFTGGTIAGALFSEHVVSGRQDIYVFKFWVDNNVLQMPDIKNAWDNALEDLKNGMLPLGGGVNRGHGRFNVKNNCGKELKNE